MARIDDFKDFPIRWNGHPRYSSNKIIENDLIEVILQKLEMILYTNKYEAYGQENDFIGADLEYYLWKTHVSNEIIKSKIVKQINLFIPELNIMGYNIDLKLFEGSVRDILEINITVLGYNASFIFQ